MNDIELEIVEMMLDQDRSKGSIVSCSYCATGEGSVFECCGGCGYCYVHPRLIVGQPLWRAVQFREKNGYWQGDEPIRTQVY